MKKIKKLIIIGAIVIIGIGVCNCSMKKNDSNDNKKNKESNKVSELVLNERQKEILEEVGLPTDVEELLFSQKEAIIAIDEMLTAIEKKYHRSFSYAGYVAAGPLEKEHLIAYPSDGSSYYDNFEVRKIKGENGTEYEDDYMNVAIRDDFSAYMTKIVSEVFNTESVKVFSEVELTETTLNEIPNDKKMYNGTVASWNCIYIDGASINPEEFESFVTELEKKLYEKKLYGISEIICLKENEIQSLNKYNYMDKDDSDCSIAWKEISVQKYKETK